MLSLRAAKLANPTESAYFSQPISHPFSPSNGQSPGKPRDCTDIISTKSRTAGAAGLPFQNKGGR